MATRKTGEILQHMYSVLRNCSIILLFALPLQRPLRRGDREYLMYYREPVSLAVVMIRLLSPPLPPLPSLFLGLTICRRSNLLTGEWGGGVEGAKSNNSEKARPSIMHSILSSWGTTPWRRTACEPSYIWRGLRRSAEVVLWPRRLTWKNYCLGYTATTVKKKGKFWKVRVESQIRMVFHPFLLTQRDRSLSEINLL